MRQGHHRPRNLASTLASIICCAASSVCAGRIEGSQIADPAASRAVLAIAQALMVHRDLDAAMIDIIITNAPERACRSDWT